jgi:hypothetical protein
MTDLLVLSGASDLSRAKGLLDTASHRGVPLKMLQYTGECMENMCIALRYLEAHADIERVVLIDSYDVLVNRWAPDELIRAIDSAPDLIMGVESNLWPAGQPYAKRYEQLAKRHPWYAINGGMFCGRRDDMIFVLRRLEEMWHDGRAVAGGSNQELLHQLFADGDIPFTLDLECRFFQSMFGEQQSAVEWEFSYPHGCGWARNTQTSSIPMFLHFNGQAPGLAEWTKRLCGQ